jgi:hypothetical protein
MLVVDRRHGGGSGAHGALEQGIRVLDRQDHPDRPHPGCDRARVGVALDPERRPADREARDDRSAVVVVESMRLDRVERVPVEVQRLPGIGDGQPGLDRGVRCVRPGRTQRSPPPTIGVIGSFSLSVDSFIDVSVTPPGLPDVSGRRSSLGDAGVRRTKTFPSSVAVRTVPAAVLTEVGPSHATHPSRS